MNNSIFNLRKALLIFALSIAIFTCALVGVIFSVPTVNASSYSNRSSLSISNNDFTQYVTQETGTPYSLNGKNWTVTTSGGVVAGVIDTTPSTFETNNKFGLQSNPNVDESISNADNYILMLRTSNNGMGKAKSETVTMASDMYYDVSLRAKNAESGQGCIVFTLNNINYSLPVVTSEWNTYHLLVATDIYNPATLDISLYLNKNSAESAGATFFDHIVIDEISNIDFYNTSSSYFVAKADLTTERASIPTSNFSNSDFSSGMDGWKNSSVVSSGDYLVGVYSLSNINSLIAEKFEISTSGLSNSYIYNNTSSLLLLNADRLTTKVESDDNLLTVGQHGYYKLTLIVKTGNMSSSNFKVTLTPTNEALSPLTVSQSSMSSAKDSMNGFATMDIFIKGSVQNDETVSLAISIEDASGYAIVDRVNLFPISMSEYSNNGTDSTKLDLSTAISDTSNLSNGRFDFSASDDMKVTYPLSPENWTFNGSNEKSGIIRINPTKFNQDCIAYGNPSNPGIDTATYTTTNAEYYNENVLMLRNNSTEDIYYVSAEKTVSAKASTVKFSIDVKTLGNAVAFVKVIDSKNNVIASVDDINTNNVWEKVNLYVKNGISSLSIRLVIGMKGAGSNQYVFYDCADYVTEEYVDGSLTAYANLLKNGFTSKNSVVVENTSTLKIYQVNGFSIYSTMNENEAVYGIADTGENVSLKTPVDAEDGYLLVINNELNTYNILSTDYTYSLSEGGYYEISIYVKTDFSSATLNGDKYGAYIELVNIDDDGNIVLDDENTNKFENIITSTSDNNGFVKYSIYVVSENAQKVKVLLGLGSEDNLTEGVAYFDDLNVVDITKSEYAEKTADSNTIVSKVVELSSDDEDEDEQPSKEDENSINIFALMSSILLIIALAFAIASVIIRRKIEEKPEKAKTIKKKPEYHTTPREVDKRNISKDLGQMRSNSLADLTKRRDSLQQRLDTLIKNYEESTKNDELVDQVKYKQFIKDSNKLREEKEYLDSAISYLKSESNAKIAEKKEIRKRQRKAKKDLKDNQE